MSNYGTQNGADTYHSDRGNTAWADLSSEAKLAALVRGTDYIDQMYRVKLKSGRWVSQFTGKKSTVEQDREWPRDDAKDYEGNLIADGTTPEAIENATYEAALREAASPNSLMPDFTSTTARGPVTQQTVGPITVKYADLTQNTTGYENRPPNMPIIPSIEAILAPYLKPTACTGVGVMVV